METVTEVAEPPLRHKPRSLSRVLLNLARREETHGDVSVACIRDALADRSLATFLVLTCLINLLPFPPPSTLILGIPIIVVALQMVAGRTTVWLPEFFLKRSISREGFDKLTRNILPWLRKLERIVRPRYWPFQTIRQGELVVGIVALAFGIFVFIPLPGTNWIPALAGAICGLSLSERDGLWLSFGVALGIASMIFIGAGYYFGVSFLHGLAFG